MRLLRTALLGCIVTLSTVSVTLAQSGQPAQAKPAAPPQPIQLFPPDARFAFIDFQRVASDSAPGKLAARILKEFGDKKLSELEAQNKQLQAMAAQKDAGVLTGR